MVKLSDTAVVPFPLAKSSFVSLKYICISDEIKEMQSTPPNIKKRVVLYFNPCICFPPFFKLFFKTKKSMIGNYLLHCVNTEATELK